MDEKVELNFETIAKTVPLIIGFLIICGSLYLDTYYSCFHINIFNYLDTTEILTTFLYIIKDIIFISACAVGYILFLKCIQFAQEAYQKHKIKKNSLEEIKSKNIKEIFYQFDKISFAIIGFSIAFCITYIVKSYTIEINSNYIIKNRDWMGEVLMYYAIIGSIWITAQFEAGTKRGLKNMIIFFALFFISFSVSKAVEKIEVAVNNVDLSSMVILENDTIKTTPKYIYLGRTNKYVFFFNLEKKVADVIPQEGIKKISFSYQKP